MSKHTPGPWAAFIYGKTIQVDIGAVSAGKNPCIVHWMGFGGCDLSLKEQKANARLIAAAPELLEALKAAVAMIDDLNSAYGSEEVDGVSRQGYVAIAKATGEKT